MFVQRIDVECEHEQILMVLYTDLKASWHGLHFSWQYYEAPTCIERTSDHHLGRRFYLHHLTVYFSRTHHTPYSPSTAHPVSLVSLQCADFAGYRWRRALFVVTRQ